MAVSQQSDLLHRQNLAYVPLTGRLLARHMRRRITFIKQQTSQLQDPDISVVIRTRNNEAHIASLLQDIQAQVYDGKVEIIVVDTESTDKTVQLAKAAGAQVITIKQTEFNYPKALNLGFEAANAPYIFTLVGHSNLSNKYLFKALTYWSQKANFGGAYGTPLPNWDASRTERLAIASTLGWRHRNPMILSEPYLGMLGANGAVLKASVWRDLGRFDEQYGAGGEDGAIARKMLDNDLLVVREPILSVYHSHGLGPANTVRQLRYWIKLSKPLEFDSDELKRYRSDLS